MTQSQRRKRCPRQNPRPTDKKPATELNTYRAKRRTPRKKGTCTYNAFNFAKLREPRNRQRPAAKDCTSEIPLWRQRGGHRAPHKRKSIPAPGRGMVGQETWWGRRHSGTGALLAWLNLLKGMSTKQFLLSLRSTPGAHCNERHVTHRTLQ